MNRMQSIRFSGVGTQTTTSGSSSSAIAVPNDASGTRARFVHVVADTAAAIKFGKSTVAATANDAMVTNQPIIVNVGGDTHYAVIQVTAGAKVTVTPVEA